MAGSRPGRWRSAWRIATGAICVVLVLLAASTGWIHQSIGEDSFAEGLTRWIVGLVAAIIIGLMLLERRYKRPTSPPDPIYEPDVDWLQDLQEEAVASAPSETDHGQAFTEDDYGVVLAFINTLTSPAEYRTRVVETVSLEGRDIQQRVSVEYVLPDAELGDASVALLPVVSPLKGQLVDNFSLVDAAGNSLADLSYTETTRLAAVGLQMLLNGAAVGPPEARAAPAAGPAYSTSSGATDGGAIGLSSAQLEGALLALLANRGLIPPELARGGQALVSTGESSEQTPIGNLADVGIESLGLTLLSIIAKRGPISPAVVDQKIDAALARLGEDQEHYKATLKKYVRALATSYPIVAVVPIERTLSLAPKSAYVTA